MVLICMWTTPSGDSLFNEHPLAHSMPGAGVVHCIRSALLVHRTGASGLPLAPDIAQRRSELGQVRTIPKLRVVLTIGPCENRHRDLEGHRRRAGLHYLGALKLPVPQSNSACHAFREAIRAREVVMREIARRLGESVESKFILADQPLVGPLSSGQSCWHPVSFW